MAIKQVLELSAKDLKEELERSQVEVDTSRLENDIKFEGKQILNLTKKSRIQNQLEEENNLSDKITEIKKLRLVVSSFSPLDSASQRHSAWANKRQAEVKKAIGEENYLLLEGFMYWCWGAKVEELITEIDMQRSKFYYRLKQMLARLPQLFVDKREDNGRQSSKLETQLAGRIIELVVSQPGITPQAVSQQLAEQDGTHISASLVSKYLRQAQLHDYQGSPYRQTVFQNMYKENFSRYAAHLLQIPILEQLGFYQAVPLLDVTTCKKYYSNLTRWHTVVMATSCGKSRLYHTGELVEDEFALILGEPRYPQRSDLHAYCDRIVAQDQAQAEKGLPEEKRLVGQFVAQALKQMGSTALPGAARAIYIDPHVIALHTKKAIARTKHGTQKRIVKALVRVQVVSANQPERALAFKLGQGNLSFRECLEQMVDLTTWISGEPVELVGVDRGALSQAILQLFEKRQIGLMVWSKDTPTMRRELAKVQKEALHDGEYELQRCADGRKVQRLRTRLADVPNMLINSDGYCCRTIVVEDVRSQRRIGIHAVGKPTLGMSPKQILAFMRGKQWVEENIKQGIAWSTDDFCGGQIVPNLRRKAPDAEEAMALKAKARQLKIRWRANLAEEATMISKWRAGQYTKRQLNDLLKGIRQRRQRIRIDWQLRQDLIRWAEAGVVPTYQVQWVVDTRKMQLMSQFHMFAQLARQDTMALVRSYIKQAYLESLVAEQAESITTQLYQKYERQAKKKFENYPWGQIEKRLFAQGGWIYKDKKQRIFSVILKPFKNQLLQRACELLCQHLNQLQAVMRCQDGEYTLDITLGPSS